VQAALYREAREVAASLQMAPQISWRGFTALSRNQTGGDHRASPFDGSITPPLRGSRLPAPSGARQAGTSRADPWACRRAGDGGGGISTPYRMQAAWL